MEIIITFDSQNWLIEDIKRIDSEKDMLILSKTNLIPVETNLPSITDQPCQCSKCNWNGTVWDTELIIDDDDNLGCPKCWAIIEVVWR